MEKPLKVITNWLLAVSAWCAMATTAFGATTVDFAADAMSVADGSHGTVSGRTLTDVKHGSTDYTPIASYAVREIIVGDDKYCEVYYRQPVTPGEPVTYDSAEAASNAMATAILEPRADVSAALGSDAARETYRKMFEFDVVPALDGKWAVAAFLLPSKWTNVVESAQAATLQIPIADIAAWQSGDDPIPVHLTNCVPGFFYSLYDGAAVTNLKADNMGDGANCNILCGTEKTVDIPAVTPPPGGLTSGFFSIGVLEAPSVIPGETETSTNRGGIMRPERGGKGDIL